MIALETSIGADWHVTASRELLARALRNFVNGEYVDPKDGRTADLLDPSAGEVFATAPLSGDGDLELAFAAAATAFEGWREATPSERSLALIRIADAVEAGPRIWWRPSARTPASRLR